MDLEASLSSIRTLADLPGLVATLGHEPLWDEVPLEGWNRPTGCGARVMAVGRTGTLAWFAVESRTPERSAALLAGRLSRRGRVSLVLALDSHGRRLAVAVAFGRVPRIELSLAQPEREAVASLARLAGRPEGAALAFAVQACDALSAETVGRRFFREFRATLDRVAAGLPGPMRAQDRHALALLQLTRVLFLYFIQTKGWLGGRERFLAEEVDRCLSRGRRLHRDVLRPLFFGTLNQPLALRTRAASAFGSIPFLNGGLFEPHSLERRFPADIPNQLWRDAFDGLFERFHFTVCEENSGGVAPDMLGRVFEGVMAPADRHASGTFYTPASLVGEILDAGLIALLARRLHCGEPEAERRMRESEPAAAEILMTVSVLDPAVGSGAFLMGALDRLAGIDRESSHPCTRKRHILGHNLFGVDQSATAVRLAELRLWLAVIADDPAENVDAISPLPNLDCLIRQGDSLFDPLGGIGGVTDLRLGRELAGVRQEVVTATGPRKPILVRRLRGLEAEALSLSLREAEDRHRADIGERLEDARGHNLFGERRGLDREARAGLIRLRAELKHIRQARRKLLREGSLPWFHYQSSFADVFARGGFDIVLGNPPWLRSEEIPPGVRSRLTGRYRWWRQGGSSYRNGPDLSVAFLERGLELTSPSGVMAMLVPAKIKSAGYAASARHGLATTATLHVVADLTSAMSQFDAVVYPMAIVASKCRPAQNHHLRTTLESPGGYRIRQSTLGGGAPWILVANHVRDALSELELIQPKLGEKLVCHLGLKTGANRIFLNPPDELEPEVLRWALRGRDLTPFRYRSPTRLLWTHDEHGGPRAILPSRATAYLMAHRAELRGRKDFHGGPLWTVFRTRPAVARYRVVWADLARRLVAAALTTTDDQSRIPLNSCYVAPTSCRAHAERVAAWLNSSWLRVVARLSAVPAAGGFSRFSARTVAQLPLPDAVLSDSRLDRLAQAGRGGCAVQEELDDIAGRHLGLSPAAEHALRSLVDDRTPNSR
ncbi:MAG: Eco57I restriction-modification methylase domain-containing protein [Gemmatimonadales bacterium]